MAHFCNGYRCLGCDAFFCNLCARFCPKCGKDTQEGRDTYGAPCR